MHPFCEIEEPSVPLNNIPLSMDAHLVEERHHPHENFHNASTYRG